MNGDSIDIGTAQPRSEPGKYAFASSAAGSIGHLTAEVFLSKIGADVQHVPDKGSAGALTDVLSGRVAFMWDSVASVSGQVASGAARAYAVSSGERTATLPDVPSLSEASNIKDFDMVAWVGLMAPKGTPPERLDRINDVLLEVLKTPEVSKQFLTLGIDPFPIPRAQAAKVIAAEVERLGAVAAESQVAVQ
ncbi:Bug family tripartite tricarboxylate transporter substrate binding protein [Bordetella trematum]|uniref:Bug family tripartite tricarboxylate transporter substrate binding protein n=1 Tax=Bordetella trematum TaxID=123899 RepID=UPI0015C55A30